MSAEPAHPNVLLVRGLDGQATPRELERLAAAGERPRAIPLEVARALDADVLDLNFVLERGSTFSRVVARRVGILEGQVVEAFLRRREYGTIVAFADRLGLELALVCKLTRSRRDLVLVSSRLVGSSSKRFFLGRARVQSHIREIISYSSVQLELGAQQYGLPRARLHALLQPVDERFWRPQDTAIDDLVCSVGSVEGYRDYPTLFAAVRDLPVQVELAVGSFISSPKHRDERARRFDAALAADPAPPNVRYRLEVPYLELRDLYARSRFVVMPLKEADFDAGVTSITEAMAMGKAVIATRIRGQVDVLHDGVEGLYVPAGDPAALRKAIDHLQRHPDEAARMGAAGRAAVIERHRLDDFARAIAEISLGQPAPNID
jgi:glycosyltransferase involved in cell wall biosynthesis